MGKVSYNELMEGMEMEATKRPFIQHTLTEGDILFYDDTYHRIDSGEVLVYADGSIDEKNGELVQVSADALSLAVQLGKEFVNVEELRP